MEVDVTRAGDGVVQIGGGSAGPAFARAVLDVAGAALSWSVLDDASLPTAEIHDPARAQQWLWALYGRRTAAAVHQLTTGRLTEPVTALSGTAARLALGHWAARWWPASILDGIPALDPDLLGLELAALTYECQQLFDDSDDQPDDNAVELIDEHQSAIDPLIEWWVSAPTPQVERILRLIDDAADNGGLDGPAVRRLRSALGGDHPARTSSVFGRRHEYALAAGDPLPARGRVIATGTGTNDWCRYPSGFVDAAENAVTWTVHAIGAGRRIDVDVVAGTAYPADGVRLAAEIGVDGGRPFRVLLTRRNDVWAGGADLDIPAASTPRIEVGVLLPGFDPGPSTDDRAAREAVRAMVRRRLTGAVEPFLAELAAAAGDEDF